MTRRRFVLAGSLLLVATVAMVVRNQVKVYEGRQARAAQLLARHPPVAEPAAIVLQRRTLFELLRPVAVTNCELERFGEPNDGGYLMCGNLLDDTQVGYSYGISGYDDWGCEISDHIDAPVHQYDCFDTTEPWCIGGDTRFHAECVGDTAATIDGRRFDTIAGQFVRNGDAAKRVVLKIDVEGAEWDSFVAAPDATLRQIDQLAVEFHWAEANGRFVQDEQHLRVVRRLKQFFEVAHIHFNNASCVGDLAPFPTSAYEVLFVSKRLATVDRARPAGGLHPLDAPNNAWIPDCQPETR